MVNYTRERENDMTFQAIVVKKQDEDITYGVETVTQDDLSNGEVLIKVAYSSINYKDMLAVQPNGGVIRDYPMIPGIDLSGTVEASDDPNFTVGQEVLVTGFGTGVTHTGGFAEYARIPAEWIVSLPEGLSLKEAMIYGTAGFTAALSIQALENDGMDVADQPHILVTGATGGVGSVALQILSKIGYKHITALVRKEHQIEVAKSLGATDVVMADTLAEQKRPLAKQQYHYVVDTVGGDVAAAIIPQLYYDGSMSMCGNAAGLKISTTVLPFILRGIHLLGVDSVQYPAEKRPALWHKLATDWHITDTTLHDEIALTDVPDTITALQQGQHLGRTIIKM